MIGSHTQGHWLPMVASAALLRRVGRVDFEEPSASFCRFAGEVIKELRPCRIGNTFGQTMIVNHSVDMQIFNTDGSKRVDNPSALLVGEIVASPFDAFMHPSDHLAMPAPLVGAFLQAGVFVLNLRQGLFFVAEEARIGNFLPGGEGGKGFESNINADGERVVLQLLGLADHRKGDGPFSSRGAMNGTGFDGAFDLSMIHHFDAANLREAHAIIVGETEARLGIGDAIVASVSLKARKSRLLTRFTASEEGFVGQIDTHRDILQDLGMNLFEQGVLLFQHRIGLLLLEAREGNAIAFVGSVTHFQQLIIQDAAHFEMCLKRSLLFFRRIDPVLIVFQHSIILRLNRMGVKKIPICPIPSRHQKERPFIPGLKTRGFLARHGKVDRRTSWLIMMRNPKKRQS
jgi:hypothetical protein